MPAHRLITALAAAGALALSATARADEERDAARALADKANELYEAGRYEEAARYFQKAESVFHAPTLLLRLARSHVKLGKLVAARDEYGRVVGERLSPKAPREFTEAQNAARAELAALERKLPRLTVAVPRAPEGVTVSIDGEPIPRGEIGMARPCDPGSHVVTIAAPGARDQARDVVCREGASERIDLALAGGPADSGDARAGRGSATPAIVALGLGAAALGVGAVTGVMALGKASDLKQRCPTPACDPGGQALADSAHGLATASTIGFIAGGALAAAGVVLLVVRPGRAAASSGGGRPFVAARFGLAAAGIEGAL